MIVVIPWYTALIPVLVPLIWVLGRVVVILWSLRGTKPKHRAAILHELQPIFARQKKPPAIASKTAEQTVPTSAPGP